MKYRYILFWSNYKNAQTKNGKIFKIGRKFRLKLFYFDQHGSSQLENENASNFVLFLIKTEPFHKEKTPIIEFALDWSELMDN